VASDQLTAQMLEHGVVLLRDFLSKDLLLRLKAAAVKFFQAISDGDAIPERYLFNRFSHSALLNCLTDFGCTSEELLEPLCAPELNELFSAAIGSAWTCRMEQSWVRMKFNPLQVPNRLYQPQGWHQDGALGVQFPPQIGPSIPMTELVTYWIPLTPCGENSPGLEFVRRRQTALLHFTELGDSVLRQRFQPTEFSASILEVGDCLVFLNTALHRTYVRQEMRQNRLSVEYRIFPDDRRIDTAT
jgi:hypothetical protein